MKTGKSPSSSELWLSGDDDSPAFNAMLPMNEIADLKDFTIGIRGHRQQAPAYAPNSRYSRFEKPADIPPRFPAPAPTMMN